MQKANRHFQVFGLALTLVEAYYTAAKHAVPVVWCGVF